jgi:hypothetical protein
MNIRDLLDQINYALASCKVTMDTEVAICVPGLRPSNYDLQGIALPKIQFEETERKNAVIVFLKDDIEKIDV